MGTTATCVYPSVLWCQEDVSKLEGSLCNLHRLSTCKGTIQNAAVTPVLWRSTQS